MMIELSQAQVELLLGALQERQWALAEEAAGKSQPRPGSPRHAAQVEASAVRALIEDIEEQQEQE
tara:strand:- start:544 stop:738 length:195 start_codon:yes stop_codon:yes gene_type:complete